MVEKRTRLHWIFRYLHTQVNSASSSHPLCTTMVIELGGGGGVKGGKDLRDQRLESFFTKAKAKKVVALCNEE